MFRYHTAVTMNYTVQASPTDSIARVVECDSGDPHRRGILGRIRSEGLWRSWERASMAWKRAGVGISPGPPKPSNTYRLSVPSKAEFEVQLESKPDPARRRRPHGTALAPYLESMTVT